MGRDPDGYERSYLTDFGLSRNPVQDSRALTAAGTFVGTYYYAAPEQILGKDFDHRVDVYSLTCLLFESLTGQPRSCTPAATRCSMLTSRIRRRA